MSPINLNLKKRFALTLAFFWIAATLSFADAPTNCHCDDDRDPVTELEEIEECERLCMGADVPVNGNVWILAAAGIVLFIVKDKFLKRKA